jgi:hypothetical protein
MPTDGQHYRLPENKELLLFLSSSFIYTLVGMKIELAAMTGVSERGSPSTSAIHLLAPLIISRQYI